MDAQTAGTDGKRIPSINRQILLASRPNGEPSPDNFQLAQTEIPQPGSGQMLLRTVYLSLDPYMRGRMDPGPSYAPRVEIGQVMVGRSICEVVESKISNYQTGDIVLAGGGWQEYVLFDGVEIRKIDHFPGPISQALGVLGMPGLTAYTGLLNIGRPKPGETLVVAAASGAVGSVVGQIAKIKGCRVLGIAGGEEKCRFVKDELGFDDCLDHRQPDLPDRLKAACSNGIDIYFENVGGHILEAVLPLLNNFSRIPVCGLIAHYCATDLPTGPNRVPELMGAILKKRLTFQGFIVVDYASQYPNFMTDMSAWLKEGRIKYREDIVDGLENAPQELIRLLRGANFGKKIEDHPGEPGAVSMRFGAPLDQYRDPNPPIGRPERFSLCRIVSANSTSIFDRTAAGSGAITLIGKIHRGHLVPALHSRNRQTIGRRI